MIIRFYHDLIQGIQWRLIQKTTRFQRLIGVFSNESLYLFLTSIFL